MNTHNFINKHFTKRQFNSLNLGCGTDYQEGYINVDISDKDVYGNKIKVDVVHDLNIFPYPFPDNHFLEIKAQAIVEHLYDRMKVWHELYRIAEKGCVIKVVVPHYSGCVLYDDPTHYQGYSTKTGEMIASMTGLTLTKNRILVSDNRYLKFLDSIINLAPRLYEKTISGIIPSHCIEWEFVKL